MLQVRHNLFICSITNAELHDLRIDWVCDTIRKFTEERERLYQHANTETTYLLNARNDVKIIFNSITSLLTNSKIVTQYYN